MVRRGVVAMLFAALAALAPLLTAVPARAQAAEDARSGLAGLADLAGIVGRVGAREAGEDASAPKTDAGFLTVTSDPAAKLEIDGADTGKTTPVTRLSLSAGKHKVTLTSIDGKTKRTLGVTIVAGEEKHLTVNV